ncbi:hypothetical protein [Ramlibacter tataouinensis]|uniref:Uncharacterized protein n=1 Tax=Ramlibacter tataouinensis (strain ATCC BAA-407 / DSM 14655 / LMG 21543 / TTB310) TaxID=365046 RepID=F5Y6H0_RAMTT|nr:hypothetical protein [Ramlibacter tataouinensis]AEG94044.1 hypothetical protein Rta_29410 [Ramlibacter tataouinensis TTB310]
MDPGNPRADAVERAFDTWRERRRALQAHSLRLEDALQLHKEGRGPLPAALIDEVHALRLHCDLLLDKYVRAARETDPAAAAQAPDPAGNTPVFGKSGRGAASVVAHMQAQAIQRSTGASSSRLPEQLLQEALEDLAGALESEWVKWMAVNSRSPGSALFDAELTAEYHRAMVRVEAAKDKVELLKKGGHGIPVRPGALDRPQGRP